MPGFIECAGEPLSGTVSLPVNGTVPGHTTDAGGPTEPEPSLHSSCPRVESDGRFPRTWRVVRQPVHPSSGIRSSLNAALMRARWLNACGESPHRLAAGDGMIL